MSDHEETDLVQQLLTLQRDRAQGALEIGIGAGTARVLLDAGRPCAVVGGVPTDTLGRLLVAEGVIGTAQYAAILARLIESAASGKPLRFGDVAVEFRFLTAEQLREALAAQIKHKVLRCLRRGRAVCRFDASARLPDEASRFPTNVEPLLVALASSFADAKIAELLRLEEGKCPRLIGEREDVAKAFQLRAEESAFLGRLDGATDARELLDDPSVDAGSLLAALMLSGKLVLEAPAIELGPESAARRPSRATMTRRRLSSLPSARSGMRSVGDRDTPPTARLEAEAALRKLTEPGRVGAQGTFSGAPRSQNEARLRAEASFQLGLGYLRGGAMARAVVELRRAASLLPGASEYLLYARWAEYAHTQSALGPADRATRLAAVEIAVAAACRDEPDLAYAQFVAGQLKLAADDEDAALEAFTRAVRLDPELLEAQREVRLLELKKRRTAPSHADLAAHAPSPTIVDPVELVEELSLPPPPAAPPLPSAARPPPAPVVAAPPPAPPPPVARPPVAAPAVEALASVPSPPKPSGSRRGVLAVAALVLLGGGGAALWHFRGAFTVARPAPTAKSPTLAVSLREPELGASPPTATSTATATSTPTPTWTPTPNPTAVPGPTLVPSASASAASDLFGEITTGSAAAGHRVIVDGHALGDAPGPFRVRCGEHTVQIGSAGTPQRVDVPCGGTLTLK